jgi:tight adherence protein B
LEVVSAALHAGLPASHALAIARVSTCWGRAEADRLVRVQGCVHDGVATSSTWLQDLDDELAADAYAAVGRVWDLALHTGAPLAEALSHLTEHLREQSRLQGRLDALVAAPRASARLLALLPVVGPVLALLVGAEPGRLYLSSPVAGGSAAVGLMLTAVGWRWSSAMVAGASRPRRYASGSAEDR